MQDRRLLNKKLIIYSTLLFLIAFWIAIQPDFKEFIIFQYREIFIILFGYLPTVGIIFTFALSDVFAKNKKLYIAVSILVYWFLQMKFISKEFPLHEIILPSLGAAAFLFIVKLSNKNICITYIDFIIVFIVGGVTFVPYFFGNHLVFITISFYIWQLLVGHYVNYLRIKSL